MTRRERLRQRLLALEPADVIVLAAGLILVIAWTFRALADSSPSDFGVTYAAGATAWQTGHPETLVGWLGTPLLAVVMLAVSRVMSVQTGATLMTLLNTGVFAGTALTVLSVARERMPRWWWRVLVLALASFGPVLSTVWFKQFNLFVLAAAAGAFMLIGRGRGGRAAALLGVSIALKPLAILLPVALLIRRQTRRTGLQALVWLVGLSLVALAVLAWRAHSASVLNPWSAYENFSRKLDPHRYGYACFADNFAPSATLCRLGGDRYFLLFELTGLATAVVLALWVADALRPRRDAAWDLFAFVCALSVMVGPVAWSHYQLMLAPLFIVLLVRFAQRGAPLGVWAGYAVAFILCSVDWQPYGTLPEFVRGLIGSGRVSNLHVFLTPGLIATEAIAQFGQYVLLVTALLWYWRDAPATAVPPRAADASTAS